MSESQNLGDWFADHFRAVRETVDRERYQSIKNDGDLSRKECKKQLDALREAAGKKLLRRMVHEDDAEEGFRRRCKVQIHVAKSVLGKKRLKQPWDAVSRYVEPMLGPGMAPSPESFGRSGYSEGGGGVGSVAPITGGEDDDEMGEPESTGLSGGFIPNEEVVLRVVDLVQQPVQWGAPMFSTQDIDEPIAVAVEHFYRRTLDWMRPSQGGGDDEGDPDAVEKMKRAVKEFHEANGANSTVGGYLDALLEMKHCEPPPEHDAPVRGLYDDALEECAVFLRVEKSGTGLHKRCGFVLQKLFPDHSWPLSEARLEDIRPMYDWFAGKQSDGAIDNNWRERGEPRDKAKEVLPVILRQHQADWGDFQKPWETQTLRPQPRGRELLAWFARACQQTGHGTPATVMLVFAAEVTAELVEQAAVAGERDAFKKLKSAKGRMDRSISRLAKGLRPGLAEDFGTQLWDAWAERHERRERELSDV